MANKDELDRLITQQRSLDAANLLAMLRHCNKPKWPVEFRVEAATKQHEDGLVVTK